MGLPVEVNNLMMGSLGGYTIGRSLRFRNSASAYLSRTPASNGNQQKWTVSFWYKPGRFGSQQPILASYSSTTNYAVIGLSLNAFYNSSDTLKFLVVSANSAQATFETTAVFRDPSAWYHVVIAVDTTQATSTNRVGIYVNGVQVTSFITATYPAQNTNLVYINTTNPQQIGAFATGTYGYYDGYMAEFNFVDGQQLTPSSFGAYDTNGVWQPKKYTGTYGTNGFYLPFSNTTSTTTLVQDSSGNGNNWTPNNISLTAGTTYDSMIDSPTVSASASNYAVMNPLTPGMSSYLSNGNLTFTINNGTYAPISTMVLNKSKYYLEVNITSLGGAGVCYIGVQSNFGSGSDYAFYQSDGNKYRAGSPTAYGSSYTTGDLIGIAYDDNAGSVTFYKNNVSQGAITGLTGNNNFVFIMSSGSSTSRTYDINFGQRPFSYTPPTGFNALNTYNLPAPSIANGAQYMAATTYTGNGTNGRVITTSLNEVGLAWVKLRSGIDDHRIANIVTGGNKHLKSNTTDAESTGTTIIQGFSGNTFTVGTDTSVNANGSTYVAWGWAANGTGVTNNSGTITSTVSANTTAGFSVATFTTSGGSNPQTIGHGLGVAPSMIIMKSRNNTSGWSVYHSAVGNTGALNLSATTATSTSIDWWQNTSPTSSVWSIGANLNISGWTWVAYCFSAVSNYSAFGGYTGNGSSDGPFVFTNFRPRWLMLKTTGGTADHWVIRDTSRDTYNASTTSLYANLSIADDTPTNGQIDILSNGFKIRGTANQTNQSGVTYIYAAFAEVPYNFARAR